MDPVPAVAAPAEDAKEEPPTTDVPFDNSTKQIVEKIPGLSLKAGPRDGDQWIARLKQELNALITVRISSVPIGAWRSCICHFNSCWICPA